MRSRLDDVLRNVGDLGLVEEALGQLTAALEVSRKEWLATRLRVAQGSE